MSHLKHLVVLNDFGNSCIGDGVSMHVCLWVEGVREEARIFFCYKSTL